MMEHKQQLCYYVMITQFLGLSYTEFSYHLLQSYDFLWLHRKHGCQIQLG